MSQEPRRDAPESPRRTPNRHERTPFRPGGGRSATQRMRTPDYLVIGHITVDLLPGGDSVLGGTALYSAMTAARLGARVAVLTRGVFGQEVAGMQVPSLEPYLDEHINIIVQDADVPTAFINEYRADRRVQTMPHWAGPIDLNGLPPHWRNAKIVHLGPIADELDPRACTGLTSQFLGATPQGWMREWPRSTGGPVKHIPLKLPGALVDRLDSVIVSDEEIVYTREIVNRVGERRLSVMTRGPEGAQVIAHGQKLELPGHKVRVKDLTGAGDVFAAAFFLQAAERGVSAQKAGQFANAVAALSVTEVGPFGVPTRKQVQHLLETGRVRS
ncbi:MAG: PfkB family carbohydrate kinase [Chloroflexota bacterium]|nr:PfkB family carbohydrate kinase [Chloroflexota bacterium]